MSVSLRGECEVIGSFQPPRLCAGCSLCLECSFPRSLHDWFLLIILFPPQISLIREAFSDHPVYLPRPKSLSTIPTSSTVFTALIALDVLQIFIPLLSFLPYETPHSMTAGTLMYSSLSPSAWVKRVGH